MGTLLPYRSKPGSNPQIFGACRERARAPHQAASPTQRGHLRQRAHSAVKGQMILKKGEGDRPAAEGVGPGFFSGLATIVIERNVPSSACWPR